MGTEYGRWYSVWVRIPFPSHQPSKSVILCSYTRIHSSSTLTIRYWLTPFFFIYWKPISSAVLLLFIPPTSRAEIPDTISKWEATMEEGWSSGNKSKYVSSRLAREKKRKREFFNSYWLTFWIRALLHIPSPSAYNNYYGKIRYISTVERLFSQKASEMRARILKCRWYRRSREPFERIFDKMQHLYRITLLYWKLAKIPESTTNSQNTYVIRK